MPPVPPGVTAPPAPASRLGLHSAAAALTGLKAADADASPPHVPQPRRPQTHSGAAQRQGSWGASMLLHEEELAASGDGDDAPACGSAGAAALQSLGGTGACRLCTKLRIRLEHEERARVKAQEQLAKLQAEGLARARASGAQAWADGAEGASGAAPPPANASPPMPRGAWVSGAAPPTPRGAGAAPSPAPGEDVARALEGYRREVALLKEALAEQDRREAELADGQRRLRAEHAAAQRDWEAQLAGLVCEVQDLEARNHQLETAVRRLAPLAARGAEAADSVIA